MQAEASKEGNDADATSICLPAKEQIELSLGKTTGRRPKQHLQRGEVRSQKTLPLSTRRIRTKLLQPTSYNPRQSLEGANQWKDNKQLLMATMKGFCMQGR
jgi:hypothetical protein